MSDESIADILRALRAEQRSEMHEIKSMLSAAIGARTELSARMDRIDIFCEEKRRAIAEMRPFIDEIRGSGPHDPGLRGRVRALEEEVGIGTGEITLFEAVSHLQRNTLTKSALIAFVGVITSLWTIGAGVVAGLYFWLKEQTQ